MRSVYPHRRAFLAGAASALAAASVPLRPLSGWAMAAETPIILNARPGTSPLAKGLDGAVDTEIWGYDGAVPGPTIRCRRGEPVHVRLVNGLDEPTSIHWHGLRIDNAMDGVIGLTQDPVAPGASFDYMFTPPDAGTFWYHTHNRAWEQMARGLYGRLIVEGDDPEDQFDRDLYLALDDWRLDDKGQIETASFGNLHDWAHEGRLGNWLTVNGTSQPSYELGRGERMRLRLLNAANARTFRLQLKGANAKVIALDGAPVEPFALPEAPYELASGQRVDLAVDVDAGDGGQLELWHVSRREEIKCASFPVKAAVPGDRPALRALDHAGGFATPDLTTAVRQDLVMTGGAMGGLREAVADGKKRTIQDLVELKRVWALNGIAGDMDKPLLSVKQGTTVVITMKNDTAWSHAMHLHGHHFKAVERNGKPVTDGHWRDTEMVDRDQSVALAFVADNPGKWFLHCHMLEHQAAGMRTWINIEA